MKTEFNYVVRDGGFYSLVNSNGRDLAILHNGSENKVIDSFNEDEEESLLVLGDNNLLDLARKIVKARKITNKGFIVPEKMSDFVPKGKYRLREDEIFLFWREYDNFYNVFWNEKVRNKWDSMARELKRRE